jgi:hypothetical protein
VDALRALLAASSKPLFGYFGKVIQPKWLKEPLFSLAILTTKKKGE